MRRDGKTVLRITCHASLVTQHPSLGFDANRLHYLLHAPELLLLDLPESVGRAGGRLGTAALKARLHVLRPEKAHGVGVDAGDSRLRDRCRAEQSEISLGNEPGHA